MVDVKWDALATPAGVIQQWQFLTAMYFLVSWGGHFPSVHFPLAFVWVLFAGLFGACALILCLLALFGIEPPKEKAFWYYVIGAFLVFCGTVCGACSNRGRGIGYGFGCTFSEAVLFAYSAYLSK